MQYIDASDIVQFVKAAIMVISVHLKISTFFVVSHVLSAVPWMEVKPRFQDQENLSLSLK